MSRQTGIRVRHSTTCRSLEGGRCSCTPGYEAAVYSKRDGRKIRRTFTNERDARAWRAEVTAALQSGAMRAPRATPLRDVAEAWLEGARSGTVHNRSGEPYKPSVIRGYEQSLRLYVLPDFGGAKLGDVQRRDVQGLVDQLVAAGLDASTVRNAVMPLRVICRRALVRGEIAVNPTSGLELPAVRGRRDRVVPPREARALLLALPIDDRALWATAMYAGLRRGELMGLRWEDVALGSGRIDVARSWDVKAGPITTKSGSGLRRVPVPRELSDHLAAHRLRAGWPEGLVFGRSSTRPFNYTTVLNRAKRAWKSAGLDSIGLHECRHTFASWAIDAGVNAKALSTYMGHSSIAITLDRYGHLMPGNEAEAGQLIDAYLDRSLAPVLRQSAPLDSGSERSPADDHRLDLAPVESAESRIVERDSALESGGERI